MTIDLSRWTNGQCYCINSPGSLSSSIFIVDSLASSTIPIIFQSKSMSMAFLSNCRSKLYLYSPWNTQKFTKKLTEMMCYVKGSRLNLCWYDNLTPSILTISNMPPIQTFTAIFLSPQIERLLNIIWDYCRRMISKENILVDSWWESLSNGTVSSSIFVFLEMTKGIENKHYVSCEVFSEISISKCLSSSFEGNLAYGSCSCRLARMKCVNKLDFFNNNSDFLGHSILRNSPQMHLYIEVF